MIFGTCSTSFAFIAVNNSFLMVCTSSLLLLFVCPLGDLPLARITCGATLSSCNAPTSPSSICFTLVFFFAGTGGASDFVQFFVVLLLFGTGGGSTVALMSFPFAVC